MNSIFRAIQKSSGRLTKVRKAIVSVLVERCCLLTRNELVLALKDQKITPDRSTIYRELQFLEKNSFVRRNTILGTDYFEIPSDHHHHLVCLGCNKIEKVEIGNHLEEQEGIISRKNDFVIIDHLLEFYGYCSKCKKNFIVTNP